MTSTIIKNGRVINLNSVDAFQHIDLEHRQDVVLDFVREFPNQTAKRLTAIMRKRGVKVQESTVTPRLSELTRSGEIVVSGTKVNYDTGRKANAYVVRGYESNV
ncbi:MAG: hypothetical protein LBV13_01250 [Methanomassiliicoccaceae archaeon]|nr:hypothetical protein [Methanomassiliicoccaceae archaeon]